LAKRAFMAPMSRDARRRLPLRPGARAGARAVRGEPAGHLLRHHRAGPGAVAGEAHRRALGPRSGRLPGRQLPDRLDGVERQVPRQRPALLAWRRRPAGRARLPPHGKADRRSNEDGLPSAAWLEAQTGVRYETLRRHYGKWLRTEGADQLRKLANLAPNLAPAKRRRAQRG